MDQWEAAAQMHALPGADERPFSDDLRPRFLLDVHHRMAARATDVSALPAECTVSACLTPAWLTTVAQNIMYDDLGCDLPFIMHYVFHDLFHDLSNRQQWKPPYYPHSRSNSPKHGRLQHLINNS